MRIVNATVNNMFGEINIHADLLDQSDLPNQRGVVLMINDKYSVLLYEIDEKTHLYLRSPSIDINIL